MAPYEIVSVVSADILPPAQPKESAATFSSPWEPTPLSVKTPVKESEEAEKSFMVQLKEQSTSIEVQASLAQAEQKEPPSQESPSTTIKVALLLPLSGPHKEIGTALFSAAQIALFDIADPFLELLPRDTKGTEEGAIAAAKLAIEEGAQLIIGPLFSHEALAIYPYTHAAGIKTITFSNDSRIAKPDLFVFGFIPDQILTPQIQFLEQQHPKKMLIVLNETPYGQYLKTFFLQQLGPTLQTKTTLIEGPLTQDTIPQNITTYDVIWMPDADTSITNFVDHLKYLYPDLSARLVGSSTWDNPTILNDPSFKKAIYMGPNPALRDAFMKAYKTLYHKTPAPMVTLAYDALSLAAILARHHPKDPFSDTLLLTEDGFKALNGLFRFEKNGIVTRRFPVIEIQRRHCIKVIEAPKPFSNTNDPQERHTAVYCYGNR